MNTMFLRHIFMAGLATACGIAVSAGTFAFLLVIGVIPRMLLRLPDHRFRRKGPEFLIYRYAGHP